GKEVGYELAPPDVDSRSPGIVEPEQVGRRVVTDQHVDVIGHEAGTGSSLRVEADVAARLEGADDAVERGPVVVQGLESLLAPGQLIDRISFPADRQGAIGVR